MTKENTGIRRPLLVGLFFVMALCFVLCSSAFAAQEYDVVVPILATGKTASEEKISFHIDFDLLGVSGCAGVQCTVTWDDARALKYNRYNPPSGANPYVPAIDRGDTYKQFGFYISPSGVATNRFNGRMELGSLEYTYTGSAEKVLEISIDRVVFLHENRSYDLLDIGSLPDAISNRGISLSSPAIRIFVSRGENVGFFDHKTKTKLQTIVIGEGETPLFTINSFAAFIEGFNDNTFRGNDPVTREQFVTILSRLKNPYGVPEADKNSPSFGDVKPGRWSFDAIEWAKSTGIVDVTDNFRPADTLTRAEMAVMLVRAENLTEVADNTFSDLAGHPDASSILRAVKAGIFTGYADGTFKPEGGTIRYEAVTALVRYLVGGEPPDSMWIRLMNLTFSDVTMGHWAYKYVVLAVNGYTAVPIVP